MCLQHKGQTGTQVQTASKGITLWRRSDLVDMLWICQAVPETLLSDPQLRGRAQRLMIAKDSYHSAGPLKTSE